jgi:uncharacterized membrane protein YbaN (DUF454 family)
MWWYFDPQPWERSGWLYARLGVRRVRGLVVGGLLWQRWLPRLAARLNGQRWIRRTVERYVVQSMYAEVGHTTSLLFILVVIGLLLRDGDTAAALMLSTVNLLVNLLPITVLRYNRGRILARRGKRTREIVAGVARRRGSDSS